MISLILPAYNEQENISELYRQLSQAVADLGEFEFEFIFVDDGSTDTTAEMIESLRAEDPRVELVRLTRNFGSHAAIAAGLCHCRGRAAIVMPTDLQDPPSLISRFIETWKLGSKVVWGVRSERSDENPLLRLCSLIYYATVNRVTNVALPALGADTVLIDREVIEHFKKNMEKNSSYVMLISWLGYPAASIEYQKQPRYKGETKWTVAGRIKFFIDSVVSYSYFPLRLMSLIGLLSALIGVIYGLVVVVNYFLESPIQGWSSLMVVVLLLGGLQLIMMGILGEYVWRSYDESRMRPQFIVRSSSINEV